MHGSLSVLQPLCSSIKMVKWYCSSCNNVVHSIQTSFHLSVDFHTELFHSIALAFINLFDSSVRETFACTVDLTQSYQKRKSEQGNEQMYDN